MYKVGGGSSTTNSNANVVSGNNAMPVVASTLAAGLGNVHGGVHQQVAGVYSGSITPRTQAVGVASVGVFSQPLLPFPNIVGDQQHVTDATNVILAIPYSYNDQILPTQRTRAEEQLISLASASSPAGIQNLSTELANRNQINQSVSRFAIDPQHISLGGAGVSYPLANDELHYVEYFVLQQALQKLANQANLNPGEASTVVIDIFGRETHPTTQIESIKLEKDQTNNYSGYVETHAVTLWQKDPTVIVLIDPSSIKFSRRIVETYNKLFPNAAPKLSMSYRAAGANNVSQMYSSYDAKGATTGNSEVHILATNNARDCIDVAVKIAFEIQAQHRKGTPNQLMEEEVEKVLSNNSKLNTKAAKKLPLAIIRTPQSSISGIRILLSMLGSKNMPSLLQQTENALASTSASSGVPISAATSFGASSGPMGLPPPAV